MQLSNPTARQQLLHMQRVRSVETSLYNPMIEERIVSGAGFAEDRKKELIRKLKVIANNLARQGLNREMALGRFEQEMNKKFSNFFGRLPTTEEQMQMVADAFGEYDKIAKAL